MHASLDSILHRDQDRNDLFVGLGKTWVVGGHDVHLILWLGGSLAVPVVDDLSGPESELLLHWGDALHLGDDLFAQRIILSDLFALDIKRIFLIRGRVGISEILTLYIRPRSTGCVSVQQCLCLPYGPFLCLSHGLFLCLAYQSVRVPRREDNLGHDKSHTVSYHAVGCLFVDVQFILVWCEMVLNEQNKKLY